jgi:hypothetical protein
VPYARTDGVLLPVPYDFDSTGIVDAPYAAPATSLRIQNVRQRLYRGPCRDLAVLEPVFDLFAAQRTAIAQLFTPAAGLTERSARRASDYIDDFYAVLADPEEIEKKLRNGCDR